MAKPIRTVAIVVAEVDEPVAGIRRLVLMDQDQWELPPFAAGAHIDLHLETGLVRTYSLCNEPSDRNRYVVAVKRELNGRGGSQFVHDNLRPGSRLGVSLPRGGIRTNASAMNVFIAGGIGITPFISVIRGMEERNQTNYVLHWVSMGEPSLADMIQPAIRAGRARLYDARHEALPDIAAIVSAHGLEAHTYCCGPASMLDAFEVAVEPWPAERKHVERFTAPKLSPSSTAAPYTVILAASREEMTVLPDVGLLATLETLGVDVPVSCGGGICGACRTRWLEGPPIHRDRVLSPAERESEVIVCVAECAGPRLVLDL
jgi:ferredoxin-NADP reductase